MQTTWRASSAVAEPKLIRLFLQPQEVSLVEVGRVVCRQILLENSAAVPVLEDRGNRHFAMDFVCILSLW